MVERLEKIRLRYGEDETRLRKMKGERNQSMGFTIPKPILLNSPNPAS